MHIQISQNSTIQMSRDQSLIDLKTVVALNQQYSKERFNLLQNSLKILDLAYKTFSSIKIASSFGLEDVVIIDLACKVVQYPVVFFLDTGRLHEETYEIVEKIRKKYPIQLEIYTPDPEEVKTLIREKGYFSFYESVENRKECCYIRKVKPLQQALKDCNGWITGLRRGQGVTRVHVMPFELDIEHNNMIKINPLFNWGLESLWQYIKIFNIPYNSLHDAGFPSIGCKPCTRAIQPGEDIRAGRWWWEAPEQKECGLHKR